MTIREIWSFGEEFEYSSFCYMQGNADLLDNGNILVTFSARNALTENTTDFIIASIMEVDKNLNP